MANRRVNARLQKHREARLMAKLRPVRVWAPDTRSPGFSEECRRQSRLVARSDAADAELWKILDTALADI